MPSADFMQSVLSSESAQEARGELVEEPLPVEEPEQEEGDGDEQPAEEEAEGGGEEQPAEDDAGDDEAEAEEEAETLDEDSSAEVGEEFYLRRYRTREDAERAMDEHIRFAQEKAQEAAEMREMVAFLQGEREARSSSGEQPFEEWAGERLSVDPERGLKDALEVSIRENDGSYVFGYLDQWEATAEENGDTRGMLDARTHRLRLEEQLERAAQQQPPAPERDYGRIQNSVAMAYQTAREDFDDMEEGSPVFTGAVNAIRSDEALHGMLQSGDVMQVHRAIVIGRERYLAEVRARQPRRASRASQEEVGRAKVAGRVSTGNGTDPARPTASEWTPEEQSILDGAAAFGLKLRGE